nr:hypothetical protein [Tanacetum cinerariifolium]
MYSGEYLGNPRDSYLQKHLEKQKNPLDTIDPDERFHVDYGQTVPTAILSAGKTGQTVGLKDNSGKDLGNQGGRNNAPARVYAVGRAGVDPDANVLTEKYVKKGFPIFLAHITMKEVEDKSKEKRLEDVPVVRDFFL